MNSTALIVGRTVDIALTVLLGDKLMAQDMREIRRIIEAVANGDMTEEEAYQQLRDVKGDLLDQVLGNSQPDAPAEGA